MAKNDTTISINVDYDKLRNKPLLNAKEVQSVLQLGRTSTYEFLKNNPPFRILNINHSIRIPSKDFFNWIDNQ